MHIYATYGKRIIDLIVVVCCLPIAIPLLLFAVFWVLICDGPPPFYVAARMGYHGRRIRMYKIRTMLPNAPDWRNADGSTFNSDDDSRLTKSGKYIRKLSLDELPQLFNVLRGDMSIVGPRPTLYRDDFKSFTDLRKKRYNIRPGITGYTQAHYRNSIGQNEKFVYDAWYVDNVSLILDIKIIFATAISCMRRKHIYKD